MHLREEALVQLHPGVGANDGVDATPGTERRLSGFAGADIDPVPNLGRVEHGKAVDGSHSGFKGDEGDVPTYRLTT